jgi:hypothetical protein
MVYFCFASLAEANDSAAIAAALQSAKGLVEGHRSARGQRPHRPGFPQLFAA